VWVEWATVAVVVEVTVVYDGAAAFALDAGGVSENSQRVPCRLMASDASGQSSAACLTTYIVDNKSCVTYYTS